MKNFNRNLIGGKRPNKGIEKYGKCKNISERLKLESKSLEEYLKITGLLK